MFQAKITPLWQEYPQLLRGGKQGWVSNKPPSVETSSKHCLQPSFQAENQGFSSALFSDVQQVVLEL